MNNLDNIDMVCIDFDKTLISIHTGGRWYNDIEKLKKYVRVEFIKYINNVLSMNKKISIVTFSNQVNLIDKLMKDIFPNKDIYIYGWLPENINDGKQKHIELACKDRGISIDRILLIDDSYNNIEIAKNNGIKVHLYQEEDY